jgi:hypothetical protein
MGLEKNSLNALVQPVRVTVMSLWDWIVPLVGFFSDLICTRLESHFLQAAFFAM